MWKGRKERLGAWRFPLGTPLESAEMGTLGGQCAVWHLRLQGQLFLTHTVTVQGKLGRQPREKSVPPVVVSGVLLGVIYNI